MNEPRPLNRYILLDHINREIDLRAPESFGWGRDYYLNVFRAFERRGELSGLTVYISYHAPQSLPTAGPNVVLVIIGDEFHQHRGYFHQLGAILRCHGPLPEYCDGWPTSLLQISGLLQWLHKYGVHLKSVGRAFTSAGFKALINVRPKTLSIPLGLLQTFEPNVVPVDQRRHDYGFMGSNNDACENRRLLHRILMWPKVLSRAQMLKAMTRIGSQHHGITRVNEGFEQSLNFYDAYVAALADTRIAIVPRGTCYGTYRFFEACKAGCVIVCDPVPDTWFYKDHPGIVIRNWADLPGIVDTVLTDPEKLQKASQASYNYWHNRVSEDAVAGHILTFLKRTMPGFTVPAD
ncbi:glycosyltransferase [Asticcacaulis machinosus]|uniref:Glycosyltransferase n=1 Tax=Asticcacaulis machinosus TaxID=2984211 RepID=A0ABT5HHH8_9CAUL|nr:glycosyltransferase [Asticcacaulis machinosus]MDC7675695.1 glycosyltransferase [Asticcacaulis machinosus]